MVEEIISTDTSSPVCTMSSLKYPNGRFDGAHEEGGVILPDSENRVTKVVKDLIWKMGKNLLTG